MTDKTPVELWCEALRSGKYKQCKSFLHHGDAFCCLGVACELYQKHVGGLEVGTGSEEAAATYDNLEGILPMKVQKWIGLWCGEGSYRLDGLSGTNLAEDNDSGKTFDQIADIIESRPPGLFVEN